VLSCTLHTRGFLLEFEMKNLIDVKAVVIGDESVQAVSARELYLDLGHDYKKWNRWHKRNYT